MNKDNQEIRGLEAAYVAVFQKPLRDRIMAIWAEYSYMENIDNLCCELNPGGAVPCFWKISELVAHYREQDREDSYARAHKKLRNDMLDFLIWNDPNSEYEDYRENVMEMPLAAIAGDIVDVLTES